MTTAFLRIFATIVSVFGLFPCTLKIKLCCLVPVNILQNYKKNNDILMRKKVDISQTVASGAATLSSTTYLYYKGVQKGGKGKEAAMPDESQQARHPQFTQQYSRTNAKSSSESFISTVLAHLGIGNRY